MNLRNILAKNVKIADNITKSAQCDVTITQWVGSDDGYGSPGTPKTVKYKAVVEEGDQPRRLPDGLEIMTVGYVAIIQPVKANGSAGRVEPIDSRDIFTLPSGLRATVAATRGPDNPLTKKPYLHEVWLGKRI